MSGRIVPLTPTHRRDEFDCGDDALNDFLRCYARQPQERDFSGTYVVLTDDGTHRIALIDSIVQTLGKKDALRSSLPFDCVFQAIVDGISA